MKLYLNDKQRSYILEILRASETNAVNGNDVELANEFNRLYEKVKPENAAFIELKRGDAETIVEFCEIVRHSLDRALTFLENDKDRPAEEVEELKQEALEARKEIEEVTNQLQEKIRSNPV